MLFAIDRGDSTKVVAFDLQGKQLSILASSINNDSLTTVTQLLLAGKDKLFYESNHSVYAITLPMK